MNKKEIIENEEKVKCFRCGCEIVDDNYFDFNGEFLCMECYK